MWHITELRVGETSSIDVQFPVSSKAKAGGSVSVHAHINAVDQTVAKASTTSTKRFSLFI